MTIMRGRPAPRGNLAIVCIQFNRICGPRSRGHAALAHAMPVRPRNRKDALAMIKPHRRLKILTKVKTTDDRQLQWKLPALTAALTLIRRPTNECLLSRIGEINHSSGLIILPVNGTELRHSAPHLIRRVALATRDHDLPRSATF